MVEKAKILVVDDEPPIGDIVSTALSRAGHEVLYACDAQQAIEIFYRQPIDLFILDIMMPNMDGFSLCEWIRRRSNVPVIMLTAKGSLNEVVRGFQVGADDYITKPFTVKELEVRVEAILRRLSWADEKKPEKAIIIAGVHVDAEARVATLGGAEIHLTPMEFELLYYLISHAGQAITKSTLFREVWGYDSTEEPSLVEVGIRRLREKIEQDPSSPKHILTVRGIGYKFAEGTGRSQGLPLP